MRRWVRRAGAVFLVLAVLIGGAFALLQTPFGLRWLSRTVAEALSSPGATVRIDGLTETVPFHLRARHIEIADRTGAWLTLDDMRLDVSAAALLAGRLHVTRLTAASVDVHRPPPATPTPAQPVPLAERLQPPHLPLSLTVDRLAIDRLVLGAPVLGNRVVATVAGNTSLAGHAMRAQFDLHRIDGTPGKVALDLATAGTPPILKLKLAIDEPTGVLLARLLHRPDHPPLAVSLNGEGPLADWHGKFAASAGDLAHIDGTLSLAVGSDIAIALSATAAVAPLLPPDLARLAGQQVPIDLHATIKQDGTLSLNKLSVAMAAGRLTGDAELGRPDHKLSAHLHADLPHLAPAAGSLGVSVGGAARIDATLGGTEARPSLALTASGDAIAVGMSGVAHAAAHLTITPQAGSTGIAIAADGQLRGLTPPPGTTLPAGLGRDVDWSLAARASPDFAAVEITRLAAQGAGIDITGSGHVSEGGRALAGKLRLAVADLRPFTGAFGSPMMAGALTLQATATQPQPDHLTATLDGAITGFASGDRVLDALAGHSIKITGAAHRGGDGVVVLDRLSLAGAAVSLAGAGRFDPATRRLALTLDSKMPELRPLGSALATALSGHVAATASVDGTLDHLAVKAKIEATDIAAADARLDRLTVAAQVADLSQPKASIDGSFRAGDLDGTLALEADMTDPRQVVVPRLRLSAGGGTIDGNLRLDRASLLAQGTINGTVPDLARWSRLGGTPLAGSLSLKAALTARNGQGVQFTFAGDRLAAGAGAARIALGHVAADGSLNDLRGLPWGKAHASLTGARFAAGEVARASLNLDSPRPGHFAFSADADGKLAEHFTLALGGDGTIAPGAAGLDLRIARLAAALGQDHIRLARPLRLQRNPAGLAFSDLDLRLGTGQISGAGALRGTSLSLKLAARNLPVAMAAHLAGTKRAAGTLAFDASLGGSLAAPRGHFSLTGRGLSVFLPERGKLPRLGLDLAGDWDGRKLAVTGHTTGLNGESFRFTGALPLVLTAAPIGIALPQNGNLLFKVQGSGELANIADLLPLGEDRLSGHFAVDAAAAGTLAAPTATGRLTISGGRYQSFAAGATLTDLQVDLVGNRDRFTLRRFSAKDGANGTLTAQGSLVLDSPGGPSADLSATLGQFRVAARDEAVVRASGTVSVKGPIGAPTVAADLTTDRVDITLPDALPPSVTRLAVTEIGGAAGRRGAAAKPSPPALPVPLDIKLSLPGRVFVRGHGLDSEWRGRLRITGSSAAPQIQGSLQAVRGTFDLLGKTFKVTEGTIAFDGGTTIDPTLNITTAVSASDVTAQVVIGGRASAPTITLTSTPVLPQDEILARVLFDRPLGQISVGEGLQVAQAAATLAGGGPGILDRLRSRLGLDRLGFGSAPGSGSAAGGTTISGGKYIANGIYVGASQGLSTQSSKVTVEIELRPHVTVETDVGATGGSGIGLNYKYDY